jgi:creatinine amidohydrolase
LLWLNGHGGNQPATGVLHELINEMPDLRISWRSWWTVPQVGEIEKKHGLTSNHADWSEAFTFARVAPLPEEEKAHPNLQWMVGAQAARERLGDGMLGGKYQVDESIMDELFQAAVEGALEELEELKGKPPSSK